MTVLLYVAGVLLFLGALFVSIALHELGHLHYAKKFGCRVRQYMVGFGPTIWSKTINDTEYGVKLIPLGGYVKIIGMFPPETEREKLIAGGQAVPALAPAHSAHSAQQEQQAQQDRLEQTTAEEPLVLRKSNTGLFTQMVSQTRAAEFELVEPGDEDRLFYKLPVSKKVLVMLAGPAVNIALAFVCFCGVYGIYGVHSVEPTGAAVVSTIGDCVVPGQIQTEDCDSDDAAQVSPAAAAGLQVGDQITGFNGNTISSWDQLSSLVKANGDGPMVLTVVRDGRTIDLESTTTVTVRSDLSEDGSGEYVNVGYLGVAPVSKEVVTHHGPIWTMGRMGEMTAHAAESVVSLPVRVWNVGGAVLGLNERNQDTPMSVIGGSRLADEVTSSDVDGLDVGDKAALLGLVVGSFNLFIGIFNLIPLMPLDGGQIAGAAWEGIRRHLSRLLKRPDPGHVNVAKQLPLAYLLGFALVSMSVVLMIGDVVVPLRSGL